MTRWVVSRHPGAIAWLQRHLDLTHARIVDHFDPDWLAAGDRVIGTLPIQLVAAICERGGTYHHLAVPMTRALRGQELDADTLEALGATLECYQAHRRSCDYA